ncbi:uncharacterized protein LOC103715101 isoform X2 [Phoenix dactylifera]|uniref:Uncharacterized protein LOC103715101 isoform X2 n=1 Tax=Phoenix dactylifera TaxID=42345 RepID=A0A8B7CK44_PHODC|nr:uncharacterized protein LOC103715101 isoform X2 [Phoenix dactylifera]
MADSDPALSPPGAAAVSSPSTDDLQPAGATVAGLDKSQSDLLVRLQGLKQDLQNWRSKLDTQVRTYKDELSELKKSLNTELEQLRSDFQELRTTLQKQQEDVTASLRNFGMEDAPANSEGSEIQVQEDNSEKSQSPSTHNTTEINSSDGPVAESSP